MHMTTNVRSALHAPVRHSTMVSRLRTAMYGRQGTSVESYVNRLLVTDLVIVLGCALISYLVVFDTNRQVLVMGSWEIHYLWVSFAVGVVWLLSLTLVGSRRYRVVGNGSAEYQRLLNASIVVLGVIGVFTLGTHVEFSRAFTFVNLPLTLLGLLAGRIGTRAWLAAERRAGRHCSTVLVVGSGPAAEAVTTSLHEDPSVGLRVVGALLPDGNRSVELAAAGIPTVHDAADVPRVLRDLGADTVLITSSPDLTPIELRRLIWSLESGPYHLLLTPSLTDIAGPRMHARPVAGLPLIQVDIPEFTGLAQVSKRLFDVVGAAALIVLTAPFWIAIGVAVRLTGPGSVLYAQDRVGQDGVPFRILKFRTMVPGADRQLDTLLQESGQGSTPLFKPKEDPRVTSLGRVLRRYSIDEVPQLLNVLKGEMSLVGPRPQIAAEAALYDDAAKRRLIIKPGMTGLWQVSGRSRLTWEQAVRLDLYYLENWSMMLDLLILFRTVRAVVKPGDDAR